MALADIFADISDGRGFFTGKVHDISRFGLALDEIPPKMDSQAESLTLIIDGQGGHFRLKLRPRWEILAGRQKIVGGKIEKSPVAWTEFVMRFEPEEEAIPLRMTFKDLQLAKEPRTQVA